MKHFAVLIGLMVLVAQVHAQQPKAAKKQSDADLKKLQGTWVVVAAKTGDANRDAMAGGALMKFDGETLQTFDQAGKQESGKGAITLRPTKTPKEIDITVGKDRKVLGIYAFEKGKLIVCLPRKAGRPRPKDFKTAGGKDQIGIYDLEKKK